MKLNALLKEVCTEFDKPLNEIDLNKMKSNLFVIYGLISDDDVKVPGKLFDLFPVEFRRTAMLMLLQMMAQTLANE